MNDADPRVRRTRKLLQEAFVALLGEKGFHAISVQDIAERATLNRATFYAHFEDKYALMDQVVRDGFREALGARVSASAPFTLANLHLLTVTVFEFIRQFDGHCAPANRELGPLIEAKVQQELSAFLLGWLAQAPQAAGGAGYEAAASVMSWAIFGAGIEWSRGDHSRSADEWARQVLTVIARGLPQVAAVPA